MAQGKKWHEDDDKALCVAWVRATQNAVKGADQSSTDFWDALYSFFQAQGRPERTRKAMRNRWSTVRHDVSKFVGVFGQSERNARSGSSPEDVLATACALYRERHNGAFEFMHCWNILKMCPKFSAPSPSKRKSKGTDDTNDDQPGQKKAKQAEQDTVLRQRELKRLDRIATAMEEKNRILQCRMLLRYGPSEERDAVVEDLKAAIARAREAEREEEEETKDNDATFSESTIV